MPVSRDVAEGGYAIGEWRLFGRGSDAKRQVSAHPDADATRATAVVLQVRSEVTF